MVSLLVNHLRVSSLTSESSCTQPLSMISLSQSVSFPCFFLWPSDSHVPSCVKLKLTSHPDFATFILPFAIIKFCSRIKMSSSSSSPTSFSASKPANISSNGAPSRKKNDPGRHHCWVTAIVHKCNHVTYPPTIRVMHRIECPGPQSGRMFCDNIGEEPFYAYVRVWGKCGDCKREGVWRWIRREGGLTLP